MSLEDELGRMVARQRQPHPTMDGRGNPKPSELKLAKHFMEMVVFVIDQHIPSLTDEDEADIDLANFNLLTEDGVNADLAIRTCACGAKIDGYYQYVDHLKEVLK